MNKQKKEYLYVLIFINNYTHMYEKLCLKGSD